MIILGIIFVFILKLSTISQEKTRANAAGALGNFVRNSDTLTKDLIKYGALQAMRDVVVSDPGPVKDSNNWDCFNKLFD